MLCIKCRQKSVIEIRRHNASFCELHFLEYFENQVNRNIRRHRMCGQQDRILVAVSGGKDSLALWDVLTRFGYATSGIHIQMGIGAYSSQGQRHASTFAETNNRDLITVDLNRDYGMGVPELSRTLRRVPCSGCGMSRRYIFNREAYRREFTVVATGHNLDDEAATLLGNVLHWQMGYLAHQAPILESTHPKFVKKIKPLYTLTERETAAYCLLRRIPYHAEECPNSVGARSLLYKEALNQIELRSPGAKHSFLQGFIKQAHTVFSAVDKTELHECPTCGQPTTAEVCAFCRMWDEALARRERFQARQAAQETNRA